jgi:hypothetical protein
MKIVYENYVENCMSRFELQLCSEYQVVWKLFVFARILRGFLGEGQLFFEEEKFSRCKNV